MKRKIVVILAAAVIGISSASGVVLASNPHCNGNSDNVHLPNQHTSQDFPACG